MCTRFVYNGIDKIVGFNFDIDLSVWNHTVITEENRFYIGIKMPDGLYPVSYTHLDVYKRQVSYFTVNAIVGELDFPSSEIFYFQQQQFTFPVDTSMNVEIVENRKALTTVRNKKKELKDLDNHAYQAGSETLSLIHI